MKSANDWHKQLTDMGARIARCDIAWIQKDATEELLAACKVGVSTITDILKAEDRGDAHSGMGGYWINLRATLHIIRDAIAKSKLPAEPKEKALETAMKIEIPACPKCGNANMTGTLEVLTGVVTRDSWRCETCDRNWVNATVRYGSGKH